ncbi:polyprotein [Plakobranchus ocellatus]|uniref:Polyprotein n=1 Tax=Plakobranchus ocellatus TaxID=259542 RepID=A0AAV4AYI5_9GAST|nr:polyprotein [Plakobranchus ocellatus]
MCVVQKATSSKIVPCFWKKKCSACGKPNHFKDVCRSCRVYDLANEVSDSDDYEEGEKGLFVGTIGRKTYEDRDELFVHVDVLGTSIKFKVDTGAQANVLPQKVYQRLKDVAMTKTTQKLTSYTGNRLRVLGKCIIEVKGVPLDFFVTDTNQDAILGLKASQNLQLIKILTVGLRTKDKEKSKDNNIVNEHKDVFQGLGRIGKPVHIELDPNAVPVVHSPRRIPLTLKDKVKEELDRMEDIGVIMKQDSPTPRVNSMVVVEKPNGALRTCMDPRDLNKAIQREHFSIPSSDEITAKMSGAKFFSKFDAGSGFWQIPLDHVSSRLCTFQTPFGRYSFPRCPFGISSAPEVFNKRMKEIYHDEEGVASFFDDVITWGRTLEELKEGERACLEKARHANLKFRRERTD